MHARRQSKRSRPLLQIACQLASAEGDLARVLPDELEAAHRVWKIYRPGSSSTTHDDDLAERGEMWRWIAAGTLLLLVLETLWAAWIGRGRRLA